MCSEKTTEWSNEDDEMLIDFVKVHECLYNVQLKDYRKTQMKQNLWNEIGKIINKTGSIAILLFNFSVVCSIGPAILQLPAH